jgi:hypothetical protein
MFIFLLAILIIPVFIGKGYSEGFTNRDGYEEKSVTGYANKVWPIVQVPSMKSSMHFDKANGNIVLQTDDKADKIITRKGDETGSSGSVIKLDSPLATTVESAWTTWSAKLGEAELYYMPWDKTTFILASNAGFSGFCFDGSKHFVGDYDSEPTGITRFRGYDTLVATQDDRLDTHDMFKKECISFKRRWVII